MKRFIKPTPVALPARIANSSSSDVYRPTWQPLRPGAEDALKVPSRSGTRLTYRDGRVEVLNADF